MPANKHLAAVALTAWLFAPITQATNGYLSHGFGITSKGMAGAGMALPQDTLSVFNNPAGLMRLGSRAGVIQP
jgi:long-chain fatty acid transport protein